MDAAFITPFGEIDAPAFAGRYEVIELLSELAEG